jgi:hypothetical protein
MAIGGNATEANFTPPGAATRAVDVLLRRGAPTDL